jgi:hypothetical protein
MTSQKATWFCLYCTEENVDEDEECLNCETIRGDFHEPEPDLNAPDQYERAHEQAKIQRELK